jgi:S1-C subfamily serine protease
MQEIKTSVIGSVFVIFAIFGLISVNYENPLVSVEYATAQQNITSNLEKDFTSQVSTMIRNVRDSVVGIILPSTSEENLGPDYIYDGSGFVYKKVGDKAYIVTNDHVVSDYENEIVGVHFIDNGALFEANVTSTDPVADIAVLEITMGSNQTTDSPIEPLTLANSSEIRQGQQVLAIGSPSPTDTSIPNIVTSGIISKTAYTFEDEGGKIIGAVVIDVPIVGGNSGGPLLNMEGEVIGMVAAGDDVQCCSYAIPSNTIKQIVPVLIEDEEYIHPWIGLIPHSLGITEYTRLANVEGVGIHSIERDGPAHLAGLKGSTVNQFGELQIGDIITAVDGKPTATAEEFEQYIDQNKMAGESVELTISRNGTIQDVTITLGGL